MHTHCSGAVIIDENDIGKTDIQILTDLIYETNKLRIPEEHIKYGAPSALDSRPDVECDHNTFVPFKIDPDYNYRLAQMTGFVYRRREFGDYMDDIEIVVDVTEYPFHVLSVLDQINEHLPFPLSPNDIVDYVFNEGADATTFPLIANPRSYLWTGRVNIRMNPLNPVFFKLVPNPYIPGFFQFDNPV